MTEGFETDDIFTQLESVTNDPVVERIQDKVREYQAIINEIGDPTRDEIIAVIHDLDSDWPYFDVSVQVVGKLRFINAPEPRDRIVDGIEVLSKGFDVYRETVYKDGDEVGYRLSIIHLFVYTDSVGNKYRAHALPDDVAFEFPFDSSEARRNRLEYHHPELIEEIDEIVLNSPHEDEALEALKYIMIGEGYDQEATNDIGAYLTDLLEFDQYVPYEVVIDAPIYIVAEDGELMSGTLDTNGHSVLIGIDNIEIIEGLIKDEPELRLIAIKGQLLFVDSRIPPRRVVVPLASIGSIHSTRRRVYEN